MFMSTAKDLRLERARFSMSHSAELKFPKTAEALKDAPLRVRRLGLPLALATWSREGNDKLIELLAEWLFDCWGALGSRAVPKTPVAFLNKIQDLDITMFGITEQAKVMEHLKVLLELIC
jgi:hypothetical protein